jgi:F0F1-type ATP synthase membrane subunit b/b'
VSPALANFLFEAANFLLLVAALGWLLFTPVRRALDAERERHRTIAEEDDRLRREAEALAREARTAREAAEHDTAARRVEVLAAAQAEAARLLDDARTTQAAERRVLERELAIARDAEAAALADTVGRIAAGSVVALLDAVRGPSLDAALVRAACTELASLPAAARKSAVVESARPLDDEARRLLHTVVGNDFDERVVDELGAGVRVTTAAGQVDATAISFARRAARAVSNHANDADERREGEHD